MWTPPRISDLRHWVTIQQNVQTRLNGILTDDWQDFTSSPAMIETAGGQESYPSGQELSTLSHQVTIRWQPRITAAMRIKYEDENEPRTRYFAIKTVRNSIQTKDWLLFDCYELQGGQGRAK